MQSSFSGFGAPSLSKTLSVKPESIKSCSMPSITMVSFQVGSNVLGLTVLIALFVAQLNTTYGSLLPFRSAEARPEALPRRMCSLPTVARGTIT